MNLLALAGDFLAAARLRAGVERIALLGSILTHKPSPKDIDVLVTVRDECDLEPLALLSRRMQGRSQSLNRGADVFLASVDGRYLGRICPWRDCYPGKRRACDAAHCGARPFLHNDLGTIALRSELVSEPPLELYPHTVVRVPLPDDVARWLTTLRE